MKTNTATDNTNFSTLIWHFFLHRYIADRFLPDKAIDVMDEAGSRVRIAAYRAREQQAQRQAQQAQERRGDTTLFQQQQRKRQEATAGSGRGQQHGGGGALPPEGAAAWQELCQVLTCLGS